MLSQGQLAMVMAQELMAGYNLMVWDLMLVLGLASGLVLGVLGGAQV